MIPVVLLYLVLQSSVSDARQHQQAGEAAFKSGHTDTAIAEFRKVVDLAPDQVAAYVELGTAYMQTRDYASAIPIFRKALELDSQSASARGGLGYALLARGYAREAASQFEKTADRGGLGISQLEMGDLPDAVQNLNAALATDPNNPDLLYYLARATGLLLRQLYDSLLTHDPDSPRANQALAENHLALHQTKEAEERYQAALRARPDLPGIHLDLGQVYATSAQWDKAESEFRLAAQAQPGSAEAAFRLGSALLQNGKVHEARPELQRADTLQPDMPETLYALGKAESLEGNSAAAENAWKRVIALEKTGSLASQAHFGLATMYRKQGKTADAQAEMEQFEKTRAPSQ